MKTLVTGAIGFVGINVVRSLAERGNPVVALYRTPPDQDALDFLQPVRDQVTLVAADVENQEQISAIVRAHKPEGIIHAAAMTPRPDTERALPARIMNINFMGTIRVLEAAREDAVGRFIFVSSNGLYGGIEDPTLPVTEDTPARGEGLYAIAKIASEAVCKRYKAMYGMHIASGRVCSTYGPMERPTRSRVGMSAICTIASALVEGRVVRVRAGSEHIARSWTHVADIAEALVALMEAPQRSYDAYNVSYGVSYTVQQILDAFQQIDPGLRYEIVGPDEQADVAYGRDAQRGPMDITRLRKDTGFQPRFDLAAGIADYMEWIHSVR
jgi:nucleoside-diphosphate-sugar epimerase